SARPMAANVVLPFSGVLVSIDEVPDEVVVRVAGEATFWHVDKLSAALLSLSARRPSHVVLDLSGLTCVSSLAIGVLVQFRRGIVRSGGRVCLAPILQNTAREALARAGVIDLFRLPEIAGCCRTDTV